MQIPWRAAPRAALSSPLTLLVSLVTALLLSFVVAAAVLHSGASGSAAIAYHADRLCAESLRPNLESKIRHAQVLSALDDLKSTLGDQPMLPAFYTAEARTDFGGRPTYAKFGYRPGATDHLKVLEGGGKDGLWVPKSIAVTTDLQLGKRGMGGVLPPVTAVYEDVRDPLDPWWCSERQYVVPNPISARLDSVTAVVWMPTAESFAALPPAVTAQASVTVRFPGPVPQTVDEADALVSAGTARLEKYRAQGVRVNSPLTLPVDNARETVGNVRSAILPLALISLLIGLAGVATVTAQWAQRRHAELWLLWVRGSGPAALGGRALLELGLPLVAGGALGLVAARLLLPVYAPSTALPPGSAGNAVLAVLVVVALSLVIVWSTTALRAHRAFQKAATGSRARRVLTALPWELVTAGLAVWSWFRVRDSGFSATTQIGGLPRIDAAALAFPLLVVLTAALLAARLARWALKASHRAALWRRPAAQLAIRRLAAAAGPVTGVLLVGVLAIGTIAVGSGIAGSQQTALADKSGIYTGAESTVRLVDKVELPPELRGNSTVVGMAQVEENIALVVDPDTFNDGAYGEDIDRALLAQPLRIGDAPRGEVSMPGLPRFDPRAHLPSFPKLGTAGWVVPIDQVPDEDGVGSWYVWSAKPLGELTTALAAHDIRYRNSIERTKAVSGLPFLTIQWTFGFVTAVGVVLAVVAAIALLLAIEVRRRQNAVSGAFSTRMGLRPAALLSSHLLELGALAVAAVVVGLAASTAGSRIAVPRLDPAPRLAPGTEVPNMAPLFTATVVGSALVVLVAAWIAVRAVRTARIGELIRG
ncbi:ABC transporter permease [Saccharothrix obliqua]|uniref:ABC transporter permease n=1 Tax=Saccharothrix obliqua TaxID=2861747 RepID=UPI001C5F0AFB|nr:ABC transporter permease [Saccharothrix obliqua]MBW4721306.1 ABC transporter permease [Saccharothrix obliqua]